MKDILRPHLKNTMQYQPGKPEEEVMRELGLSKVIKLASNENPLGPSPMAIKAIIDELPRLHRYPEDGGFYLREALSAHLKVAPEMLVFGAGGNEILRMVSECYMDIGTNVVLAKPSFVSYAINIQVMGVTPKFVPVNDKTFTLEPQKILDTVDSNTRVVFIDNPNNPLGSIMDPAALQDMLLALPDHLIVVLDEAYYDFIEPQYRVDGIGLINQMKAGLIVLRSFSKGAGIAGIRIGYGISSPQVIADLNRIRLTFNTNRLAQVAAIASLKDSKYLDASVKLIHQERKYLYSEFDNIHLQYIPTQANYIMINVVRKGIEVFKELQLNGVIIRPTPIETWLRVTIGTHVENEFFITALKKVLGK
jgi:histidinol-phosphate aminotransferase